MSGLASALADFSTVWGEATTLITGSSILMVFLAGGILMMAARVFKRFRKSVRQQGGVCMTPSEALSAAAAEFTSTIWPAAVSLITDNYYLMLFLFGGLVAACFHWFSIAKDSVL